MTGWRGGVVRRSELVDAGLTRRDLAEALADGSLVRVRSGWYSAPDLDADRTIAARTGGRLGCITAARVHGLWIPPSADRRVHLAVHPHTAVTARGAVLHFPDSEPPVARCADRLLVDPAAAVDQVCRCQPVAVAWVVVESALERGLVSRDEWERILGRLPARRRVALAGVGDLSGSGTESEFVRRMRGLGIGYRQQVQVGTDRVDVELDDGLLIELDSRAHHDPRVDARRNARLVARRREVLRFYYEQVWFEWPLVEAAVLAARGRRSAARSEGR